MTQWDRDRLVALQKEHSGPEVVSRDRVGLYADGATLDRRASGPRLRQTGQGIPLSGVVRPFGRSKSKRRKPYRSALGEKRVGSLAGYAPPRSTQ